MPFEIICRVKSIMRLKVSDQLKHGYCKSDGISRVAYLFHTQACVFFRLKQIFNLSVEKIVHGQDLEAEFHHKYHTGASVAVIFKIGGSSLPCKLKNLPYLSLNGR